LPDFAVLKSSTTLETISASFLAALLASQIGQGNTHPLTKLSVISRAAAEGELNLFPFTTEHAKGGLIRN
jgi:hypothetical protein